MSTAHAFDILGGSAAFGRETVSPLDVNDLIQHGLPGLALRALKQRFQITHKELARALGVSDKTIERCLKQATINTTVSDRLYRLARVLELALEVLQGDAQALDWLRSAQFGLAERIPLDLLATDAGAEEVKALLQRIRYGFLA